MNTPYLQVVESPVRMAGKGAPRDTTFGVLGHTKFDSMNRVLGGLVPDTKTSGAKPKDKVHKVMKHLDLTEHHITGHNATFIPGAHAAQVPYPGKYMKEVGKKL